jgi:hypothetical protein
MLSTACAVGNLQQCRVILSLTRGPSPTRLHMPAAPDLRHRIRAAAMGVILGSRDTVGSSLN